MTGLEFAVLCVAALLIIDVLVDTYKLAARHRETKQARFLEEGRTHRMLRSGEEIGRRWE